LHVLNGTQVTIAVGYGVLVLATVLFVVLVIRSTSARERRKRFDVRAAAERENQFAWLITGLLVALAVVSAFAIPYGETSAGADGQVVEVRGFQFGWTLEPPSVQAGTPVEFRARSADVQHGLGIYDDTKLIDQIQVPANRPGGGEFGGEQRLVHTFEEPGTYEILCLEFCGAKHHAMQATIEVTE
jgi:cytochrome c oxidase subunit 2